MVDGVSASIIDVIDVIDNGIALLFSLNIKDKLYELIYWFDIDDNYRIEVDVNFLTDFKLSSIYEYKNFDNFILFIDSNINNKKELFAKYNLNYNIKN